VQERDGKNSIKVGEEGKLWKKWDTHYFGVVVVVVVGGEKASHFRIVRSLRQGLKNFHSPADGELHNSMASTARRINSGEIKSGGLQK
jgi:hypothetical protein